MRPKSFISILPFILFFDLAASMPARGMSGKNTAAGPVAGRKGEV
jgi:hypothetical protein